MKKTLTRSSAISRVPRSRASPQTRSGKAKAAIEPERLFRRKTSGRKSVVPRNAEIIERESTSPTSPATTLVERALDYISKHATDDIAPRDVIAHLHVSPALVSKRFREVVGKTLGKTIAETRLKVVRSKLRTSNQKIETITRSCGFTNTAGQHQLDGRLSASFRISSSVCRKSGTLPPLAAMARRT